MMSEIEGPDASQGACRAQARCTGDYGEAIISLADRYLLLTIYPFSFFVTAGGLMTYGVNYPDLLRDTASYVDRIIEGATQSNSFYLHAGRGTRYANLETIQIPDSSYRGPSRTM
jgi:hypothetical protein